MINNITLIGRLVRDPELNYLQNGTAVTKFTIAVERNYKGKDGIAPVDFIPIECFGKLGENVANYVAKGRLIGLSGELRMDNYKDKEGQNRTFAKVVASSVQFLERGDKNNNDGTGYTKAIASTGAEFNAIEDDDVPF